MKKGSWNPLVVLKPTLNPLFEYLVWKAEDSICIYEMIIKAEGANFVLDICYEELASSTFLHTLVQDIFNIELENRIILISS